VVVLKDNGMPKGKNHMNGIEGFWSAAKHWLYHYRVIPKTYFPLYPKEVERRFNHRHENLVILFKEVTESTGLQCQRSNLVQLSLAITFINI
jgi:transposase